MPPQAITLGLLMLEEIIKHEPEIAGALKSLFTKTDPTPADWIALRAAVQAKSYKDFVPSSALTS